MPKPFHSFAIISLMIVAACATITVGDPAVSVTASAETKPVGTLNEDAADDPAIWRNAANPARSFIVGTDKKAGLHVYNLKGDQVSFLEGVGLNNVDLVDLADGRVLVAASDRSDLTTAHILLAELSKETGELTRWDRIEVGPGEGYGICTSSPASNGRMTIYSAPKSGTIYATTVSIDGREITHQTSVLTAVASQPEGCVVDDRSKTLYIGEENLGIWAIDMASGNKRLIAEVGTGMLVADVEGLALAPAANDQGYLVASSQGDNAYAVYRLPNHAPMGRFRIAAGAFGGTEETDGIALHSESFGSDYPQGLFVAQDGVNPPSAQNFKLVRWDAILEQLASDSGS